MDAQARPRDEVVLVSKGGNHTNFDGLATATITGACEASLRRLGTDRIDLYFAHYEDDLTPVEESAAIGNHFETWNGGIYMDAVEEAMRKFGEAADTSLVSFRQLVQWLDAQNPALLAELRDLPVGQAPAGGWASFGAHASSASSTDSAEPDGPLGE